MFSCCSRLFGRGGESLREPLLSEEREISYNGLSYRVPAIYEPIGSRFFKQLLHNNPSTENILGGWKLHISLDPGNIDDIARAWIHIIVPALISCGIREFKIVKEALLTKVAEGAEGQGKLITVYLRHNPELCLNQPDHPKLVSALNRIEARLSQASIQPGPRPVIDSLVQGSQYMSFRCDAKLPEDDTHASREGIVFALWDNLVPAIAERTGNPRYNPYNMSDDYGLLDLVIMPTLSPSIYIE